MMLNKFGVPNSAAVYIYDSSNNYKFISNTCSKNPEYGNFCFDSSIHINGDYVNLFIHGYMVKYINDVS